MSAVVVPQAQPVQTTRIWLMAFDDCDQLDITGPYEIFMQAADSLKERDPVKHALELKIVAVPGATDDPNVVRARQGLRFGCEPRDPAEALPDVLVIAGGLFGQDASGCDVGITKQLHNPAFTGLIMEQHGSGLIASVCTAALALVGTNLARGRTLTTHPGILDMVVAGGARVLNPDWEARVVDAGDIVSCGGVTSGIDEALYLVERLFPDDPALIDDVRRFVDYPYRATVKVFPR